MLSIIQSLNTGQAKNPVNQMKQKNSNKITEYQQESQQFVRPGKEKVRLFSYMLTE